MDKTHLKILLVEDDINTRSTIRAMLAEMGVNQVYEAFDGQQANEFMEANLMDINLVISDWNMPNKTGLEFLRDLRKTKPNLPFIMVTARADQNSIQDAVHTQVTGYVRKPFTLSELETKIDLALKKSGSQ